MNDKLINFAVNIIKQFIYFFFYFCIVAPVIYITGKSQQQVLYCFILLPIILCSYFIYHQIRSVALFFIAHFILGVLLWLTSPALNVRIVMAFFIVLLTSISFYSKLHEEEKTIGNASGLLLIPILISYILCAQMNYNYLLPFMQYGLLLITILYIINAYLLQYRMYFLTNFEKANVPLSEFKVNCSLLSFGFIAIVSIIMFAVTFLPTKEIFNFINRYLGKFLKWLLSLIPAIKKEHQKELEAVTSSDPSNDENLYFDVDFPKIDVKFWTAVANTLKIIFYIIAAIAVVALIIYFCISVYKAFHRKPKDYIEKVESISPFKADSVKKKDSSDQHTPIFSIFASNNEKIRKHFTKELKPKVNLEKVSYYTSMQMTDSVKNNESHSLIFEANTEELERLHTLYDKARYSGQKCTKEEYQEIKKIKL